MKYSTLIIYLLTSILLISSCRKDIETESEIGVLLGPTKLVTGSVFGLVKDEYGQPIYNAVVKLHKNTTFTDENGVFQFNAVELVTEHELLLQDVSDNFLDGNIKETFKGSYLTVEKEGFFIGSRRFYPEVNAKNNIDITLLEKELAGSFESNSTGNISFSDVKLEFSENSIVTDAGEAYQGLVHVFAKYLDPTSSEVLRTMPGDLTGINAEMGLVSLSSFGMIAVELEDSQGNSLQVADDRTATTRFPIPPSMVGNAPSEIPLWHFEESLGIWVHEGEAMAENGYYVGDLPHFSFWNCDIPFPSVFFEGNIQNMEGPLVNVLISISVESSGVSGNGYSDENGNFSGFVPANEILILEAFNVCGELIHTENIGPLSSDLFLNIVVENYEYNTLITGYVSSCSTPPSDLTYIQTTINDNSQIFQLDSDQSFNEIITYCTENESIKIRAIDPFNGLVSSESIVDLVSSIDFGEIELCDTVYQDHYVQKFGDVAQLYSPFDNSLTANIDSFIDPSTGELISYMLETQIVDVGTGNTVWQSWPFQVSGDFTFETSIFIFDAGFRANGEAVAKIEYQDGKRWFIISGTLTDIEVTDMDLYDPSYTDLYFHIAINK